MTTTKEPPRWHYRFANYRRAFLLLREALDEEELTQLEREGTIQRFEYTMELAWKVMKDYLEAQNVILPQITPRAVIRAAFESQFITDGEAWMDALDDRNRMSHTYNFERFEEVLHRVRSRYLAPMNDLHLFLFDELQAAEQPPQDGTK